MFWFALVFLVPIFGLFVYCVRCIIRSESPAFRAIPPRNKAKLNQPKQDWLTDKDAHTRI